MKTLVSMVMMCAVMMGCSAEKFPVLHPKGQEWACGYNSLPYSVVRDGKTITVCCAEGYTPSPAHPGYCH